MKSEIVSIFGKSPLIQGMSIIAFLKPDPGRWLFYGFVLFALSGGLIFSIIHATGATAGRQPHR